MRCSAWLNPKFDTTRLIFDHIGEHTVFQAREEIASRPATLSDDFTK